MVTSGEGCNVALHPCATVEPEHAVEAAMLEPKSSGEKHQYKHILPSSRHEGGMWMHWLVQLRWVALVAQAVVIAFSVSVLHRPAWTVPAMVAVMWFLLVGNHRALRHLQSGEEIEEIALFNQLGLDVVALTLLLLLSGGPDNPFVILYLVHMAMAALVLHDQAAVFLGGGILGGFTLLHVGHLPLHPDQHPWLSGPTLMSVGQYVAFTVTLVSVGYFVIGAANSWRRREQQLREARARLGQKNTEEHPWPYGDEEPVEV